MMRSYELLDGVFNSVWHATVQATVLACLILMIHVILRSHLPARWRTALWLLVVVRLLMPFVPVSPTSLFNFLPLASILGSVDRLSLPDNTLATSTLTAEQTVVALLIHVPEVFVVVWAGVALILLASWLRSMFRLRRLLLRCVPIRDAEVIRELDRCRRDSGIQREICLVESVDSMGPAVVEFLQPTIILPCGILNDLSASELRMILMHELAHIKHHDFLVHAFVRLACLVHWFNPIAWLMARRIEAEREMASDEAVLMQVPPADRRAYGELILKLLKRRSESPRMAGALNAVDGLGLLKMRLAFVGSFRIASPYVVPVASCLLILLAAMGLTDDYRRTTVTLPIAQQIRSQVRQLSFVPTSSPVAAIQGSVRMLPGGQRESMEGGQTNGVPTGERFGTNVGGFDGPAQTALATDTRSNANAEEHIPVRILNAEQRSEAEKLFRQAATDFRGNQDAHVQRHREAVLLGSANEATIVYRDEPSWSWASIRKLRRDTFHRLPNPVELELIARFQSIVDRFPHTEYAAESILLMSSLFDPDEKTRILEQLAKGFRGTSWEASALFEICLTQLQTCMDPRQCENWIAKIPVPDTPGHGVDLNDFHKRERVFSRAADLSQRCDTLIREENSKWEKIASQDAKTRLEAMRSLQPIPLNRERWEQLVHFLQSETERERWTAAEKLVDGSSGRLALDTLEVIADALDRVAKLAQGSTWVTRIKVGTVPTLAEENYRQYFNSLIAANVDEDTLVDLANRRQGLGRDAILLASAYRGNREMRDELIRMVQDESGGLLRVMAVNAFRTIGSNADYELLQKWATEDMMQRHGLLPPPNPNQNLGDTFPVRQAASNTLGVLKRRDSRE